VAVVGAAVVVTDVVVVAAAGADDGVAEGAPEPLPEQAGVSRARARTAARREIISTGG
jgi:hypothetical protein